MGKELLNRNKMASMDDRQKQVEDKKQELLRRIAEKKKIDKGKPPPLPPSSDGNTPTASRAGPMFLNDGNFLARFQAMQQQSTSSPSTSTATITGPETRPTVSMKLTTVKKSTPVKPVSARPEVFEDPEEVEENGNLNFISKLSLRSFWGDLDSWALPNELMFQYGVILISLNARKCSDERYN